MSAAAPSISTIDCQYLFPRFAASYLMWEGEEALFIENNTSHAVPLFLAELKRRKLRPEQVRYAIITHVHLDHAGGTSALLEACPHATVLAHPRAAPHVIDPSKLVASARKVYGDETFDRLYGVIKPVDPRRVRIMADSEEIAFGSTRLRFLHTRGHANHHFCVQDVAGERIFTGDAFGVAYPDLQAKGLFLYPSTSPTDFDPDEAVKSVDRIVSCGAREAYLTHFGPIRELSRARDQMREHLDFSAQLLHRYEASDWDQERMSTQGLSELRRFFEKACAKIGLALDSKGWALLELDLKLNADGIAYAARKRREKAAASPA